VNISVIGCGRVSPKHISAWRKTKDKIIAVVDKDVRRAKDVAKSYGVPYVFSDLGILMENHNRIDLDVVDICTPPHTHHDIAIKALNGGIKNILVEKPLALNVSECEEIMDVADENEAHVRVCHNYLFKNSIQKVMKLMDEGKLGHVKQVDIHHMQSDDLISKFSPWFMSLPAGIFGEGAVHPIYIMQSLTEAFAQPEIDVLSQEHVTLRFKGEEMCGNVTMLYGGTPRTEWTINVYGSEMMAHVDVYRDILLLMDRRSTKPVSFVLSKISDSLRLMVGTMVTATSLILKRSQDDSHERLIKSYSESCKLKTDLPDCSLGDGKRVVEVIDAIADEMRERGLVTRDV